jgi:hypothetical protein
MPSRTGTIPRSNQPHTAPHACIGKADYETHDDVEQRHSAGTINTTLRTWLTSTAFAAMQASTPISLKDLSGKAFLRANTYPIMSPRTTTARPLSEATEIFDTDGEDDSEFEEAQMLDYPPPSPHDSIGSVGRLDSHAVRRMLTT